MSDLIQIISGGTYFRATHSFRSCSHCQHFSLLFTTTTANSKCAAARLSGNKLVAMEELDTSSKDDGFVSAFLKRLKRWFLNHSQHLNFFTILVLASVSSCTVLCDLRFMDFK